MQGTSLSLQTFPSNPERAPDRGRGDSVLSKEAEGEPGPPPAYTETQKGTGRKG